MTIAERCKLRDEILQSRLRTARDMASRVHLSADCRAATLNARAGRDPGGTRALHARCHGEDPGHGGCLCLCHDTVTGSVEAGVMTQMDLPVLFEE